VVTFEATLQDECATFDRVAYKANLAAALPGVTPDRIFLTVVCGSVKVTASIAADNQTAAESLQIELAPLVANTAVAEAALKVALVAVTPALVGPPLVIPAPSPPPQSPPSPSPPPSPQTPISTPSQAEPDAADEESSLPMLPIIIGGVVSLVLVCACGLWLCGLWEDCHRRRGCPPSKCGSSVSPDFADGAHARVRARSFRAPAIMGRAPSFKKADSLLGSNSNDDVDLVMPFATPSAPPPPLAVTNLSRGLSRGFDPYPVSYEASI